jgi:D-beta-D-heptose 7-phosphate kinase/D-beta-D-heptose 1-phosphate adenosyltransferase
MNGSLAATVAKFADVRLLCVGDVMLDRFIYGAVDRISPEAPIPVMSVAREAKMLGGAGNVVRNATALGATAALVAAIGDDEAGRDIARLAAAEAVSAHFTAIAGRQTTVKERYIAANQQLLRADREDTSPVTGVWADRICAAAEAEVAKADVVVLSDYAKGVLTPETITRIAAAAKRHGKPLVADPKSADFGRYAGVDVLTPNAKELAAAASLPVDADAAVEAAANAVLAKAKLAALLVTRSARGMTLVRPGTPPLHLRAEAREVFDVSGAGDTVIAVLALSLGAGASLADAALLANLAAGIVVEKAGTAVVNNDELVRALQAAEFHTMEAKIKTAPAIVELVQSWRAKGLTVGFTNGCFDLIHPGHISLLRQARRECDRLIVGLNTDASVRALKGEGRPLNNEMARAIVLAALETVDAVVLFEEETPIRLIENIKPDVLVKGADYTIATVVGGDFVRGYGGRVVLAELTPGQSTTAIIAQLQPKAAQ